MEQRVNVWNGTGKIHLGKGHYVGDVPVYFFEHKDGHLESETLCEGKPSPELIADMEARGAELVTMPRNPKILLDSGAVVYGCQVWWKPAAEEA